MSVICARALSPAGLAGLLLAASVCACASGPRGTGADVKHPTWDAKQRQVFDDGIAPSAVGVSLDETAARASAPFRDRARLADGVVRVRVMTVTRKLEGDREAFQLDLSPTARLAGIHPPTEPFQVVLDKSSPGFGIVRNFESRLTGKSFVAFARRFAAGDDSQWHVHLEADTKEVEAAVKEATALDELR